MKSCLQFALVALVSSLTACSPLQVDKIDYKNKGAGTAAGVSLEVPPDLIQLSRSDRYTPGEAVSAIRYQAQSASAPDIPTAVSSVGDVRMERSGSQRWLVVNRPADRLWDPVRDFWQESGFLLTTDQRKLGIMETDWAQNSSKLPQDIIRGTVDKVLDSARSAGELDRFRTRFELTPTGTEIYISHRGMDQVYSGAREGQTAWQTRPNDPELEAQMLRRLMVKLGATEEPPKGLVATKATNETSRIVSIDDHPAVQMDENFDRAWRRVGATLDRTGFTVEDRDRSNGVYFVRYVTPIPDKKEPGILSKLFSFRKAVADEAPLKLRILIKSQGETSMVSVLTESGVPDATENALRIVKVISNDLQ